MRGSPAAARRSSSAMAICRRAKTTAPNSAMRRITPASSRLTGNCATNAWPSAVELAGAAVPSSVMGWRSPFVLRSVRLAVVPEGSTEMRRPSAPRSSLAMSEMPAVSAIAADSRSRSSGMSSMRSQARILARATTAGEASHGTELSRRNSASPVAESMMNAKINAAIGSRGVRSYHADSSPRMD